MFGLRVVDATGAIEGHSGEALERGEGGDGEAGDERRQAGEARMSEVEHPVWLVIATVACSPLLLYLAREFFDLDEDRKEVPGAIIGAAIGPEAWSWLLVKVIYFIVICGLIIALYKIGSVFLP